MDTRLESFRNYERRHKRAYVTVPKFMPIFELHLVGAPGIRIVFIDGTGWLTRTLVLTNGRVISRRIKEILEWHYGH